MRDMIKHINSTRFNEGHD